MIKVPITYTDFDGNEVTEYYYFHLSKSDLIDMMMAEGGGNNLEAKLTTVGNSKDIPLIMRTFKEIIEAAYGERVDGSASQFFKSPEKSKAFMSSLAFDAFLTQLVTDATFAAAFVNGLMPKDLEAMAAAAQRNVMQVPKGPATAGQLTDPAQIQQVIKDTDVPDPNHLDMGNDTWPSTGQAGQDLGASGLRHPLAADGSILPWAFREPTHKEQVEMDRYQLAEVYQRKGAGWTPPPAAV